jgi:hypothetical protein
MLDVNPVYLKMLSHLEKKEQEIQGQEKREYLRGYVDGCLQSALNCGYISESEWVALSVRFMV